MQSLHPIVVDTFLSDFPHFTGSTRRQFGLSEVRVLDLYTAASFVLLLLALAGSYLPYIIPFQVTLSDAAAPPASQAFMFWGAGLFVLPLIVPYTCVAYSVFRGEVSKDQAYH
ncbi:hypothetical protein F6X37_34210 [Paraburkholderia sp. 31.1]|nr:hypothetical protein [Paraburkholderia sp. 31.1]